MKQLSALEINTEAKLRSIMELIFDQAALAQTDCAAYGHMRHPLNNMNFHRRHLERCQSEVSNEPTHLCRLF